MKLKIGDNTYTGHRPWKVRDEEAPPASSFKDRARNFFLNRLPVKAASPEAAGTPDGSMFAGSLSLSSADFGSAEPTVADIRAIAKDWGTDDLASVLAVVMAIYTSRPDFGKIPRDPTKIFFLRNTEKKFCAMGERGTISNNPNAVARVIYHPASGGVPSSEGGKIDFSRVDNSTGWLPGGGINFLVTTDPFDPNYYGDDAQENPDALELLCTLEDVLKNGKVYGDISALMSNAVVVEMQPRRDEAGQPVRDANGHAVNHQLPIAVRF